MRKQSMIGGGEFEFEPHKLEERFNNRQTFLQSAKAEFIRDLNKCAMEYQEQGLGIFENFRKDIVRALVMELRK
ncbi:hypothetical protein ACSXE3_15350 (plasmid) [Clostridium perfringens]